MKGDAKMEWLDHMNHAISYIEDNLEEKMDYNKVAQAACCSLYHFQRMFSYMAQIPLAEYKPLGLPPGILSIN